MWCLYGQQTTSEVSSKPSNQAAQVEDGVLRGPAHGSPVHQSRHRHDEHHHHGSADAAHDAGGERRSKVLHGTCVCFCSWEVATWWGKPIMIYNDIML